MVAGGARTAPNSVSRALLKSRESELAPFNFLYCARFILVTDVTRS